MEELLRAIEELKRAYKASGVFNVEVCLSGDHEAVNIVRDDGTELSQIDLVQQKPLTNGEWLRGLSDEELAKELSQNMCVHCVYNLPYGCGTSEPLCEFGMLNWLCAEHKGVE